MFSSDIAYLENFPISKMKLKICMAPCNLTGFQQEMKEMHQKFYFKVSIDISYLIFVIFFTQAKFLENKIYTEKTHKLRQNTQKIAIFALLRQNTQ